MDELTLLLPGLVGKAAPHKVFMSATTQLQQPELPNCKIFPYYVLTNLFGKIFHFTINFCGNVHV